MTITFSEAVNNFTNAATINANGTLTAVSSSKGGLTWTATLKGQQSFCCQQCAQGLPCECDFPPDEDKTKQSEPVAMLTY